MERRPFGNTEAQSGKRAAGKRQIKWIVDSGRVDSGRVDSGRVNSGRVDGWNGYSRYQTRLRELCASVFPPHPYTPPTPHLIKIL